MEQMKQLFRGLLKGTI